MCAGCLTTIDSWVYTAVGLGAAAEAACYRFRALVDREYAAVRHVLAWERNAAFCEYVGLDPVEVLGPKPAPLPVLEPAWTPSPRMAMAAGA